MSYVNRVIDDRYWHLPSEDYIRETQGLAEGVKIIISQLDLAPRSLPWFWCHGVFPLLSIPIHMSVGKYVFVKN